MIWLLGRVPTSIKLLLCMRVIGARKRRATLQQYLVKSALRDEVRNLFSIWRGYMILGRKMLTSAYWDEPVELTVTFDGEYSLLTLSDP